jgi:hypothetical protein
MKLTNQQWREESWMTAEKSTIDRTALDGRQVDTRRRYLAPNLAKGPTLASVTASGGAHVSVIAR